MADPRFEDVFPLSPAQRGMLFESLVAPGSELHVEQFHCRLHGELDADLFAAVWRRLLERHAMLRTAFVWQETDEPLQVVLRQVELAIGSQDWRALSVEESARRLAEFLVHDRQSGFRLARPPLMRLTLLRVAADVHWLVWTYHHILMDGWCGPLLLRECLLLYGMLAAGGEVELAPVCSYGDYVGWLARQDLAPAAEFWRRMLAGVVRPTPLGKQDGAAAAAELGSGHAEVVLQLPEAESAALQQLAKRLRLTLNTLVQGAWALLLHRHSGGDPQVVFGITISGRPPELPHVEETVGLFVNTLPVRFEIPGERRLDSWLAELQARNLELRDFCHTPTEWLRQWTAVPGFQPLFESVLVFENYPAEAMAAELAGSGFRIDEIGGAGARTNFAITLLAAANPQLWFKLVYQRRRLGRSAATLFLDHLQRLLAHFAAAPEAPVASAAGALPAAEVPRVAPPLWAAPRTSRRPYVAPATVAEEIVASILQQVVGSASLGREDDFFELGGHSLLATEAVSRLRQAFRVDLRLRHLFTAPTVAGLAARISRLRRGAGEESVPELPVLVADREHRHDPFPLTDIQQAYWIGRGEGFVLSNVATHTYMETDTQGLDLARLVRSWRELIARHEMLRAVVLPGGEQRVLAEVPPYEVPLLDLAGLPPGPLAAQLAAVRQAMSHQVLPADRWPLFDLRASRLPGGRLRLHLSFDLLVADGWSWGILFRDLAIFYGGGGAALPPLEVSFRDYVLAERRLETGELYARSRRYWLERLADMPGAPELPLAGDPARIARPRFVRREDRLDAVRWGRLKERATRAGLTPSTVLLAAFAEVLARWSKSPRFTINLTLFHRLPLHPQIQELVGDFTSLTLLAVVRPLAGSFGERARQLQDRLWDDLDHRYFSGVRVLRELARSAGDPSRAAMPIVFTSTLNLTPPAAQVPLPAASPALALDDGYSIGQTPQVLLDHQVQEREGELQYNWDAVEEAFPPAVLDEMFAAYCELLSRLAAGEEALEEIVVTPLALSTPQRRRREAFESTAAALPAGLLHGGFERQVELRGEEPAVIAADRQLTYRELDALSGALARRLRAAGARPDQPVALVTGKGWEELVAALAVLRAGAAYLPIDSALPPERIATLLELAAVELAVTCGADAERLSWPAGVRRLELGGAGTGAPEAGAAGAAGEAFEAATGSRNLAYVIFTSGSTGTPKGVAVEHGAALNTLADVNRRFAIGPADRVLALSALGFDLSVFDLFGVLAAGGAVVLPEASAGRDPARWLELIVRHRVTIWNSVPALLEMLVDYAAGRPDARLDGIRLFLLSGDWIPVSLPDRVRGIAGGAQLVSLGGATEAAVWSILHPIEEVDPSWVSIPYGRPLANQRLLVLDDELEPRPEWVPGELYIAGHGLARGYWRDPVRTAAAFVPHPRTGERLYRTGDLGRFLPRGEIEFLGREDLQVKIRGHRIELGEIEAAIERHPAVRSAAVLAVGGERDRDRLVAFVVPRADEQIAYLDLKLSQAGARRDVAARPVFELAAPELDGELRRQYRERRSARDFHSGPVGGEALGRLLAALRPLPDDGSPLPKYRYPSAGSLYPVQTYLYAKPERVADLPAGGYYYDPRLHRLIQLSSDLLAAEIHGPRNRPIFERSAFSLFLVGQLAAMALVYEQLAREFCLLEAGAMSQLLMSAAPAEGLGLCPIGDLDSAPLARLLALGPDHVLLHSLIGGVAATPGGPARARGATAETGGEAGGEAGGTGPPGLVAELRAHLERQLPGYMVPAAIVLLGALPLGANGKVDRRQLRQAALRPGPVRAAHRAPDGAVEERLAAIWSAVLELERVGVDDHFLDLGGDSIKAIQMLTRAREQGMELTVRELFEHPTIAGLAARLRAAPAVPAPAAEAAASRSPAARPLVSDEELSQTLEESADE